MNILIGVVIFSVGLAMGSFLSVLLFRLDQKEGILTGRSECTKCLTRLKWYDLVPVLSFLAYRGRCHYCQEKISPIYPVMELSVACTLLAYYLINGPIIGPTSIYEMLIIFIFLALIFFDYSYYILPDKIIFTGLGISFFYRLFFERAEIINSSLTGLGMAGFFAIIYLMSHGEWMGFGDVKLALLVGFVLGFPIGMFSMIVSVWTGALWGIGLMVWGRANLKTALPFGSFISGSAVLFIIFNEYLKILSYGP